MKGSTNNGGECLGGNGGKKDIGAPANMDGKMKRKGGRKYVFCAFVRCAVLATP